MPEGRPLEGAGATLDEALRVVDDGRVVACIGLIATYYFENGGEPSVRERFVRTLEHYLARAGANMRWAMDPFTRELRDPSGTDIMRPRLWMNRLPPREPLELILHGGQRIDDADPHRVLAAACARPGDLSYFSIGVPFSWITNNDPASFLQFTLELAERLEPSHGYAGLAAIPHVDVGANDPDLKSIIPLISRFSGLELDLPTSHVLDLEGKEIIKGVNWLTFLETSWLARLGGESALRAALGPDIAWHAYPAGIALQAGPRPLFGDRNRNEPMPHYREVAQALKPIRLLDMAGLAYPAGFDDDAATDWLTRFD